MQSGIYQIVNTINGKKYIGSTVDFKKRWRLHKYRLNLQNHHNKPLQASWNKHGFKCFKFAILLTCSKEELLVKEQAFIDWYKPEYNTAKIAGNTLGTKRTKESKEKMCLAQANRSPERRYRMGNNKRGVALTEKTKIKMSISRKGQKHSEEWKNNISKANTGKKHSEETRAKLSRANMGNTPWNKGRPCSEEEKLKLNRTGKKDKKPRTRRKSSEKTKLQQSESLKVFWNKPENKIKKSNAMKLRWAKFREEKAQKELLNVL